MTRSTLTQSEFYANEVALKLREILDNDGIPYEQRDLVRRQIHLLFAFAGYNTDAQKMARLERLSRLIFDEMNDEDRLVDLERSRTAGPQRRKADLRLVASNLFQGPTREVEGRCST